MSKKIILLSIALALFVSAWKISWQVSPACTFTALDVGQGDAMLIQTSDHQDILIDGGSSQSVVDGLSRTLPPGDRDIELMVLTHPHADHVNGLLAVTERFTVRRVLETGLPYKQQAYNIWQGMLKEKNIPIDYVRSGQRYIIGPAMFDVLWPTLDLTKKNIVGDNAAEGGGINDSSIVLKLLCGGSSAMLMGDASSDIEERILDAGVDVQASLLKVGHHGSRFSSSTRFLKAVQANWAVISVGDGNSYHHPHPTAVLRLEQVHLKILRTDELGDIPLMTDGHGGWKKGG